MKYHASMASVTELPTRNMFMPSFFFSLLFFFRKTCYARLRRIVDCIVEFFFAVVRYTWREVRAYRTCLERMELGEIPARYFSPFAIDAKTLIMINVRSIAFNARKNVTLNAI